MYSVDVDGMNCCACREVYGVNEGGNVEEFLLGMSKELRKHNVPRFLVLTEVTSRKSVMKLLVRRIERKRWGSVVSSSSRPNPNTDNRVRVYVWALTDKARRELPKYGAEKVSSPFTF